MNSSGVPTQGIVVSEATTAKKRGDRSMGHANGYVGKGSVSLNMRRRHRADMKKSKQYVSLREYVRQLAKRDAPENTMLAEDVASAKEWLKRKGIK